MRVDLAKRLLASVMGWGPKEVAQHSPVLQILADLKYDSYEQFSPGMRFIESLALWLDQFDTAKEREVAFDFVRSRLIFFSDAEIAHFAAIAYADFIRPRIVEQNAPTMRTPERGQPAEQAALFFGLSDGARISLFRRANPTLSHEQIFQDYRRNSEQRSEIVDRLKRIGCKPACSALVLLDDFSGSGTSYLREKDGGWTGKIARLVEDIKSPEWSDVISFPETKLIIAPYLATDQAIEYLRKTITEVVSPECATILTVQRLSSDSLLERNSGDRMVDLVEKYYDATPEDSHTAKGNSGDLKFGYSNCALPLILHHNTPNNSLYLLWAPDDAPTRGLFPRVNRHKDEG